MDKNLKLLKELMETVDGFLKKQKTIGELRRSLRKVEKEVKDNHAET